MKIASLTFVIFAAAVVAVYHLLPPRWRWAELLLASVVFYVSISPQGIFFLLAATVLTYLAARKIQSIRDRWAAWETENKATADRETRRAQKQAYQKRQRVWLIAAVIVNIGFLFVCKYLHPTLQGLGIRGWTAENILLPLGISYYSLQLISYVTDVSRGVIDAERDPLKLCLYSSFFLSVMQGPFHRWADVMPQIGGEQTPPDGRSIRNSLLRILGGYVKKLCIADQLGTFASVVFEHYTEFSGLGIVLGIVCFAVQLYADFAGYTDIVIGIGELLGLHLPENFAQPFFARSISEFWQKWHITLGAWLKDYVFYPLLKCEPFKKLGKWLTNTVGKKPGRTLPTYLGMLILWTLIGTWHGASFHYIFSVGLLQFLYILIGELTKPLSEKVRNVLHIDGEANWWHVWQALRTTLLMVFAWVFFKAQSVAEGFRILRRIFSTELFHPRSFLAVFRSEAFPLSDRYPLRWLVYIVLCVLSLFAVDLLHERGNSVHGVLEKRSYAVRVLAVGVLIFVLLVFGAYGMQYAANNFIYYEF